MDILILGSNDDPWLKSPSYDLILFYWLAATIISVGFGVIIILIIISGMSADEFDICEQFKTFSQRIEDIEIDVYRSLHPLQAEPSEGSCFVRDYLLEWKELNIAEDFSAVSEEITPLVQTLPLVLLHKDLILNKLVSRLIIRARLSLEPILSSENNSFFHNCIIKKQKVITRNKVKIIE
ncbi:hypothetical protein QQ045_009906 [Rhodiola kirilowii]